MPGGETQANKATHREAEEVTGSTSQLFDERYCILVEGLHIVVAAGHLALTLAAEVEGHAAVMLLELRAPSHRTCDNSTTIHGQRR
jgi:hypothetical protein